MDFSGRIIAGFLAVLLITVFPLRYIIQQNVQDIDCLVEVRARRLSDTIRDGGYLDRRMYEELISFLNTAGDRYDVEILDISPVRGEDVYALQGMDSFEAMGYSDYMIYHDITYTSEILESVCSSGLYHFRSGNYVSLGVVRKDKPSTSRFMSKYSGTSMPGRKKIFTCGGVVY
ncbi:MAG: hypothetical protein GX059_07995 [Clostridiales bacterium]|jgi:hypothetical protein|nr:hypothetical protein [Clostridiales bacterium]